MTKYLIVGINSQIGASLYADLLARGYDVYGTTRQKKLVNHRIFYLNLEEEASHWIMPDVDFDIIYICAAICKLDVCERSPGISYKVNVENLQNLLLKLPRSAFIVYLSTNQVFSGMTSHTTAQTPYSPLNAYGRQKMAAEKLIQSVCQHWHIVRLTKVIANDMALFRQWILSLSHHTSIEAFDDLSIAPISMALTVTMLIEIGLLKITGYSQLSGAEDVSYFSIAQYFAKKINVALTLIQPIKTYQKEINIKNMPQFTSLDCSGIMAQLKINPPHYTEICDNFITQNALELI